MTSHTIRLLRKDAAGSLQLRWSDEPEIIGFGLDLDMAAADLADRRYKAGLSQRPTALQVTEMQMPSLASGNPRRFAVSTP